MAGREVKVGRGAEDVRERKGRAALRYARIYPRDLRRLQPLFLR